MVALLEKVVPRRLSMFDQLRGEMDRMFEAVPAVWHPHAAWREMAFVPALEIEEKENKLFVKADLPGLKKEAVKVQIAMEGLTITGERKEEKQEKKDGYFRTERMYGAFERFVPLPDGAALDKATAEFKDGVLTVTVPLGALPKAETKVLPIA